MHQRYTGLGVGKTIRYVDYGYNLMYFEETGNFVEFYIKTDQRDVGACLETGLGSREESGRE